MVASRVTCKKRSFLMFAAQDIMDDGGEGVILRLPKSKYIPGRSKMLFKFKASREDAEALVMSVDEEEDEIKLQLPNGMVCWVARESEETVAIREGDIVTLTFDSFTQYSLPTNPKIYRIRKDLSWEDVLENFRDSNPNSSTEGTSLNESSRIALRMSPKPFGYWTFEKRKNIRVLLEEFALSRNFDPLVPENWYQLSSTEVMQQGLGRKLAYYNNSLVNALVDLFPDIGLDKSKFAYLQKNYWSDIGNRRTLFVEIAQDQKFDPLLASNWYLLPYSTVLGYKGAGTVVGYYKDSLVATLLHLFPEIGLEKEKFPYVARNFWNVANRRTFFVDLAKELGFEADNAEKWYSITTTTIAAKKGGTSVLSYYNGNIYNALSHLFPEIGLQKSLFREVVQTEWKDSKVRRNLFIDIARKHQMDPLVQSNWYSLPYSSVIQWKGARSVLKYYEGDLGKALAHLFPEIGLDEKKFDTVYRNQWKVVANRRVLFEKIANLSGFDPLVPRNWYNMTIDALLKFKHLGVATVLKLYKGSLIKCLVHVFPELKFDPAQFKSLPKYYWQEPKNRKTFFEQFAKTKGFDPKQPANWYKTKRKDYLATKSGISVLGIFNGSHIKALQDSFPNLGLDKSKFSSGSRKKHKLKTNPGTSSYMNLLDIF